MSKEPHKSAHPLNDMQKEFLRRYLKTGKAKESAILAGYSPASAKKTAADMLKNNLTIKGEVERHRAKGSDEACEYGMDTAMKQALRAYDIAEENGNAAAMTAAVTLMAKLNKILDDRPVGAAFQIMISGIGGEDGQKTVVNVVSHEAKKLTGDEGEKES